MQNNITTLSARIDSLEAGMDRILAILEGKAAPVAEKAAKKGKAKARNTPKATVTDAPKVRHLVKGNRRDFIAAHAWAQPGTTTKDLVDAVVNLGMPLASGWGIGERYTALIAQPGSQRVEAPKARKPKAQKVTQMVADVAEDEPAYMSEAWIAKAHPSEGPRDAKGHTTAKMTWKMREALAETGEFDRYEIDDIIATAALNLA